MNKLIFHTESLIVDLICIAVLAYKYGNDAPLLLVICVIGLTVYSAIGLETEYDKWRKSRWKNK